ncbi:MAG: hypothetical protein KHX11_07945 [Bacteroides cellulosilyticus]|nr:hypothetical protein [Bacteroides cellulosilyticus]MBS1350290.1 hypothetical protein [Bacteroides sp.]MBS5698968.1 hypothetical protein [Bacteroides cellulosilyticus]MBU5372783.1 hypothetical protein [Bacteroides cellulosilyticus]MBV3638260.1 hypothetical protein [Bacteroides cellulosilyticus]
MRIKPYQRIITHEE